MSMKRSDWEEAKAATEKRIEDYEQALETTRLYLEAINKHLNNYHME